MKTARAFTIVELLIVIVVIAILATLTIVAYNGIQDRANMTKIQQDLRNLERAIMAARVAENKTFFAISGSGYTASSCVSLPAGTDAALSQTHSCWVAYNNVLNDIATASGANVRGLVDPWGRPYFIDENEGENGTNCNSDLIAAYAKPYNGNARYPNTSVNVPKTGLTGCAI